MQNGAAGDRRVPALARKSYLPNPGDVYWVDTVILPDYDPKPHRPVLVVKVEPSAANPITVVTRTSDLTLRTGVFSAVNSACGLNKPGMWCYKKVVEPHLWTPLRVEWRGAVDAAEFEAVRLQFGP